jgi:hypothetical protein
VVLLLFTFPDFEHLHFSVSVWWLQKVIGQDMRGHTQTNIRHNCIEPTLMGVGMLGRSETRMQDLKVFKIGKRNIFPVVRKIRMKMLHVW